MVSAQLIALVDRWCYFLSRSRLFQQPARRYNFDHKGDPADIRIWHSPSTWFDLPGGALVYEVRPTFGTLPNGEATDKLMHQLYGQPAPGVPGGNFLQFDEVRYFGFAMMLSGSYFDPPIGQVMVWQVWQGSPFGPPLAAVVVPTGGNALSLKFLVKNEFTSPYPSATPVTLGEFSISRGIWERLVVYVRTPQTPGGNGRVAVWQAYGEDGGAETFVLKFNQVVPFGYDPLNPQGFYSDRTPMPTPNSVFEVMFGLYRARQDAFHRVAFDAIRDGTTFQSVIPIR
jgi:hypothetical protein